MDLSSSSIGRKLANEEGKARKITPIEGVPAKGLGGLGSSAYGPGAALTILIPLGAEGVQLIQPIMAAIPLLLVVLYLLPWADEPPHPEELINRRSPDRRSRQRPRRSPLDAPHPGLAPAFRNMQQSGREATSEDDYGGSGFVSH